MDLDRIIQELKDERSRLDQAINALESAGTGTGRGRRPGRPAGAANRTKRTHNISPEGRRRLSEMMKKRWAERRKRMRAA